MCPLATEHGYCEISACIQDVKVREQIIKTWAHREIDKGVLAEDAYPCIKERMHKAVDSFSLEEGGEE